MTNRDGNNHPPLRRLARADLIVRAPGDGALHGLFGLNGEAPRHAFAPTSAVVLLSPRRLRRMDSRSWVSHPERHRCAISGRPCDLIEVAFLETCGPDFRPGPASHPRPQYFAEHP